MNQLQEHVGKLTQEAKIPGAFIGVSVDGEFVHANGFGFRNVDEQAEVTADTLFGIGSITKSFTCVAIMQLQEAGTLSVHDPVVTYLPEFRTPDAERTKRITIAHFMSHTSGLPPLSSLYYAMKRSMEIDPSVQELESGIDLNNHDPIDTYEELMSFIAKQDFELLGEPGTQFSYSNDGYALLGAIIERVSGKTYEHYITEHILVPAGMHHSVFRPEVLSDHDDITTLYTSKSKDGTKEVFAAPLWWDAPSMRAAGFLNCTGRDLARYAEIFRTGGLVGDVRILSPESVQQMIGNYAQLDPLRHYQYGLMVTPDYNGSTLIEHGGSLKGIAAQMGIVPEQGVTCVILTNLDGAPSTDLLVSGLNSALSLPLDTPAAVFADYEISSDQLQEYVGTYQSQEGVKIVAAMGEKGLEVTLKGNQLPLRAVAKDSFVFRSGAVSESWVRFIRDESGAIVRVFFHFRQLNKVNQEKELFPGRQTFEQYAQKRLEEAKVPGVIVSLAHEGKPFYEKTFGYRDKEAKAPINADTIFGIGSVTKSLTCVAVMQLQEAGKLSVHDPVVKYLPEFRTPDEGHTKAVTIHHFMTHTLGLPPLSSLFPAMLRSMENDPAAEELRSMPVFAGLQPIDTYEQLMDYIASLEIELLGPPGTQFSYSNDAYGLLGAIIERASGQPYEQYVQEHILAPLGMDRSIFTLEQLEGDANITMIYSSRTTDEEKEVYAAPIWWDSPSMRAAGFLKSSAADMLKFVELFRVGGISGETRILSEESVAQMVESHAAVDGVRSYGYGLGVQKISNVTRLIAHTGGIKGVTAYLFVMPEIGITGTILSNVDDTPIQELTLRLVNGILGRPLETPLATFADYEVP
ncbi:MAG: serine hydrolase, partial [Clostridia bacterium]